MFSDTFREQLTEAIRPARAGDHGCALAALEPLLRAPARASYPVLVEGIALACALDRDADVQRLRLFLPRSLMLTVDIRTLPDRWVRLLSGLPMSDHYHALRPDADRLLDGLLSKLRDRRVAVLAQGRNEMFLFVSALCELLALDASLGDVLRALCRDADPFVSGVRAFDPVALAVAVACDAPTG